MKVLILNHKHIKCGVYQFGKRIYNLAARSTKVNYVYRDLDSKQEYLNILDEIQPNFIVYNWHWDRMPWLAESDIINNTSVKHYFIYHDGSMVKNYDKYLFFGAFDPSEKDAIDKRVLLPRPLYLYHGDYPINNIPTIGSFGFAFLHKKFPELVTLVNDTFDEAIINIHMTLPYFGDTPGNTIKGIQNACIMNNRKPKIKLNITQDFVDDDNLLKFLAGNDINVFNYSCFPNPGLSSALDYALSVKRPIAISDNIMFRHVDDQNILLSKNSIPNIMNLGTAPLDKYYEKWSINKFVQSIDELFLEG